MTSPTPQSERRRAARAAASFPLQLSAADAGPARLRDISEIGLACTADRPLGEMTMVGLDFALPGASVRHHVKGAVVRCAPLRERGAAKQWDVAIYFTEITPVTRAALRNYVERGRKV